MIADLKIAQVFLQVAVFAPSESTWGWAAARKTSFGKVSFPVKDSNYMSGGSNELKQVFLPPTQVLFVLS